MQKLFACGICVSREFSMEVPVRYPGSHGAATAALWWGPSWVGGRALPCPALPLALERRCACSVSPGEPALVSQSCSPRGEGPVRGPVAAVASCGLMSRWAHQSASVSDHHVASGSPSPLSVILGSLKGAA